MRNPLTLEFRAIILAIVAVILPYGLLLFIFPNQTGVFWVWDTGHSRSSMLIGSVYLAATFYYFFILRENEWLQAQNGLGGIIIFALVLLFATMVHWDDFKSYRLTTLIWLIIYYAAPLVFPIIARLQLGKGEAASQGAMLASPTQTWLMGRGLFYSALAVLGFVFAPALSAAWPWPIQPLNLQVFMGQVAVVGWHGATVLRAGPLWRRHRLGLVLTAAIGAVQLAGLFINPTPYHWSSPLGILWPLMLAEWIVTPLIMLSLYRKQEL